MKQSVILDLPTSLFVIDKFSSWYQAKWMPWVPKDSKWHHYRVETFDGKWKKLWDKRIKSRSILRKNLLKPAIFPPRNVYYSVLKWLNPKDLGSRKVGNYSLGGPLIFDIDAKTPKMYGDMTIEKAKEEIQNLEEFLTKTYGFSDFAYTFSGKKGFHLYVKDFSLSNIRKVYDQSNRESVEKNLRSTIAKEVLRKRLNIDAEVTSDVRRIVRLPNTLHGGSGFLSLYLGSKSELTSFNLSKSIVFTSDISVKVKTITRIPKISIDNITVDSEDAKKELNLPMSIAVLLLLSGYAKIAC